jgi:ribonuclease Y
VPTIFTDIVTYLAVAIVGAVIGITINAVVQRKKLTTERNQAEEYARQARQGAEREAENLVKEAKLEAKDMLLQAKADIERELKAKQSEWAGLEKRLSQKEEQLERKITTVEKREAETQRREALVAKREEAMAGTEANSERLLKERRQALEQVSGMTVDEAKRQLMSEIEGVAKHEAAGLAKRILDEAKENAEREAREIITRSIQRVTRDYVSEATISVVPIPNDGMKGRIIGKEGRNIRTIEAATGIDLIIDETPEAVIISGFDPLRREIAKVSLERLMHDGRIHPTRIEEIVE